MTGWTAIRATSRNAKTVLTLIFVFMPLIPFLLAKTDIRSQLHVKLAG